MAATVLRAESACVASPLQANAPPPAQPRRDTPVKVRAENAGVFVHPTPDGVRATIAAGGKPVADCDGESDGESRGALLAAKRSLHHQQRVLANKVARAEERRRDVYSGSVCMFDFPPVTRPLPTLPFVSPFKKWLASRKLTWRLMRYDRRLLGAKQSKEQRELANKLAKNRERELPSTEACRNLPARELVQISERHRRDAPCPQPPFRPDLPYGMRECLVSASCFPCLLRIFSEKLDAVLRNWWSLIWTTRVGKYLALLNACGKALCHPMSSNIIRGTTIRRSRSPGRHLTEQCF